MVDKTDKQLVENFLNGDESAFNVLISRYQQKIYWHARRMTGNHLDADEILQEVLLVIFRKMKEFKFESSLYTWIYRITSTRSINYLKRKKLYKFFSIDDDDSYNEIGSSEDIEQNILSKEKLELLDKALAKLPIKQREVFVMRHTENMSYEEIAAITGKSVGGLKANYFHALSKVMELMKGKLND